MKIDLVTPMDIRYSLRGTETLMYETALFLNENRLEARVLVPKYACSSKPKEVIGYRKREDRYKSLEKIRIVGRKFCLPLGYDLYFYENVPRESIVYFPFSPYNHLLNIITKPKGQVYVIGTLSLHLKNGKLLVGKDVLENALSRIVGFLLRGEETSKNIYYQALTEEHTKYLESLGISKDRIFCIPTFADVNDFQTGNNGSKPLHVMHIGGIQKDSQDLVPVMERLEESGQIKNFVFHFIDDKQPESLAKYERDHKVVQHGMVNRADKIKLLSEMDAMVLPAVEAFSVTMLEGLASGLYLISRDNCCAKEVKKKGAHVELVASGNTAGYCNALLDAYRMKQKSGLDRVKKDNRRVAERYFDKAVVLRQIKAMFEGLIYSQRKKQGICGS